MFDASPKIWGNEFEKAGAAWIAVKWIFPMLSLDGRTKKETSACVGKEKEKFKENFLTSR
jgi:hypothetical protein